jgi:polar amino acid transport system substrate-binding protein
VAVLVSFATPAAVPLRWGADAQGGAPYVFQDPMDPTQLTGFEVELATMLAQRLGTTSQFVSGPWDRLLELLNRGDFDIALNGIEVAEEKKRVVLLSRPYFAAALVLTIRRSDSEAPRTFEALQGRRVGTLPGSLASRVATRAGAQVKTYDGGQDEIYEDLRLGRTDAVLLDAPVARYYADLEEGLQTLPQPFGVVEYAVATRLDDVARVTAINHALESLAADGSLRTLYERWGIWNAETARLLGETDRVTRTPPLEFEKWKASVGRLPPLLERIRTRYPGYLPLFAKGAALTLGVSLLAMVVAMLIGLSLAMARHWGASPIRWLCTAYIEFFRGTPLLVQLTMLYFGLPELGVRLDPLTAGIAALGLNYAAAEAENYRAGLQSVAQGQTEAATVLGLSKWQTLRFVVGPQALRIAIPPMTNDFIALLKDSSLVSAVTLTELTRTYATLANSTRDHLGLGVLVAAMYLLVGLPFARLARLVETRFSRHLRREAP